MLTRRYRERVLKVLETANVPVDVETVRVLAGIGNWMTAKAVLLELTLEELVRAEKTSKSWIFRPSKDHLASTRRRVS
jgi:hypothetical protein